MVEKFKEGQSSAIKWVNYGNISRMGKFVMSITKIIVRGENFKKKVENI